MKKLAVSAVPVLGILMFFNYFGAFAADSEIYCSPDSSVNLSVKCEPEKDFLDVRTEEASGRNAYFVVNSYTDTTYGRALKFNISDEVLYGNADFKNIVLEVEYKDSGYDYFCLTYDSLEGTKKHKDYVELYNTDEIKTASITLDDAVFANGCSSADFMLNVPRRKDGSGIYFYSVTVKSAETEAGIKISSSGNQAGNIFFDGAARTLTLKYDNKRSEPIDFSVSYKIMNGDKTAEYSSSQKNLSVGSGESISDTLNISEVSAYGTYMLCAELEAQDGKIHITKEVPFSICVNAESTGGNPKMGVGGHFNWNRDSAVGMEIIKKTGIANIRDGYSWAVFETQKGVYNEPDYYTAYINNAYNNGLTVLEAATYGNKLYGMTSSQYMPETDKQRTAYVNYVLKMLRLNEGKIDAVEVWNEPDSESYNPGKAGDPTDYVKLLKSVYEGVKAEYPNIKICGPSLSSATLETKKDWAEKFLSADIDGDGEYDAYKYFDIITIHHYAMNNGYSVEKIIDRLTELKNLFSQYGCEKKEIYHTEFGTHNIAKEYNTELKHSIMYQESKSAQAAKLSRYYLGLCAADMGERFYIYDLSNDDFAENVAGYNYGLTESDESDVPYAAKPSLLAVANINRLTAQADIAEYSAEELTECVHEDKHSVYVMSFNDIVKNQKVYAMFTDSEAVSYTLAEEGSRMEFFDMYGNRLNYEPVDGAYTFTISSEPVYARVYYGEENDITAYKKADSVGIRGTLYGSAQGDMVSIKIFDENGNMVYVDQSVLDAELSFEFTFKPGNTNAEYTVKIGTRAFESVYELSFDAGRLERARLRVYSGENEIKNMQDFNSAQKLTFSTEIYDSAVDGFDMVMAYYKDFKLIDIRLINSSQMLRQNNNYSINIIDFANTDADAVKVYLFNSINNIQPVVKNLVLE